MQQKAVLKKPASKTTPFIPYVRQGKLASKSRPERTRAQRTLKDLWLASDKNIIKILKEDGFLGDLKGSTCVACGVGVLGKMQPFRGCQKHRCNHWRCKRWIAPQAEHPLFMSTGRGSGATPLQSQAAVLFCVVGGLSTAQTCNITGANHKVVERMATRLDQARSRYVQRAEKSIQFGGGSAWCDVEADEVDLRKEVNSKITGDPDKPVHWEQWSGIVQRGAPHTLVLTRLTPKNTKMRAPGPGPIRSKEWKRLAAKWLCGRNVILHTDGARAYKLKVEGVVHSSIVHKKKRIYVKGRAVWMKPKYAKVFKATAPDGTRLRAMSGTQIIDRFWSRLRTHIGSRTAPPGSPALAARVRSAQFEYWHQGESLWAATGKMLRSLRA